MEPHPLTFRVMRLTASTPSRRPTLPFVCSAGTQTRSKFAHAYQESDQTSEHFDSVPFRSETLLQSTANASVTPHEKQPVAVSGEAEDQMSVTLGINDSDIAAAKEARSDAFLQGAPEYEGEGSPASVGTISILPASFGSIYASETFRAFISTYNMSQSTVRAVSVSLDIQSSSQRRVSLVIAKSASDLPPRKAISNIVSIPLPELGVHVLICTAVYRDKSNSQRTLRQLFRFNIFPPLEPFVNVLRLREEKDAFSMSRPAMEASVLRDEGIASSVNRLARFIVELRILNTMPLPIYITSVQLAPSPEYTVVAPLIRPDDRAASSSEDLRPGLLDSSLEGSHNSKATSSTDDITLGETLRVKRNCEHSTRSIPLRAASAGVGDTSSFVFYVSRSLEKDEVSQNTCSALETRASGHGEKQNEVAFAKHDEAAFPPTTNGVQKFGRHKSLPSSATALTASQRNATKFPLVHKASLDSASSIDPVVRPTAESASGMSLRRKIGSFNVRWRSGNGECGRMDNIINAFEPVVKIMPVEVQIAAVPQEIRVHAPFAARCVIRNNTSTLLRLYLQVRRDLVGDIVPVGISGVSLGEVGPGRAVECLITLIALSRGQHSISGIRVVVVGSRQSFNADPPTVTVL